MLTHSNMWSSRRFTGELQPVSALNLGCFIKAPIKAKRKRNSEFWSVKWTANSVLHHVLVMSERGQKAPPGSTTRPHMWWVVSMCSSWMCLCLCMSSVLPQPGWIKEGYLAMSWFLLRLIEWITGVLLLSFPFFWKKKKKKRNGL